MKTWPTRLRTGSLYLRRNARAIGLVVVSALVAILLVGRSRKMPIVVDGEIAVRLMMPLSLSYDHRLVDGGTAARFLNDVIFENFVSNWKFPLII